MPKVLTIVALGAALVGCNVTFTLTPAAPDDADTGTPMDQQPPAGDNPPTEDPPAGDAGDRPLDLNGRWRVTNGAEALATVMDDVIIEWTPVSADGVSSGPINIDDSLPADVSDDAVAWQFSSPSTEFTINVVAQADDVLIGSLTTRTGFVSTSLDITMTRETEP